jgi:hypothetical protein
LAADGKVIVADLATGGVTVEIIKERARATEGHA